MRIKTGYRYIVRAMLQAYAKQHYIYQLCWGVLSHLPLFNTKKTSLIVKVGRHSRVLSIVIRSIFLYRVVALARNYKQNSDAENYRYMCVRETDACA